MDWKLNTVIQAGGKWSGIVGKGHLLTFTAVEAGANVSLWLYNALDPSERYNMPDTLKAQHTAHLTKGHVLLSDNGRVLASLIQDEVGWHDPLGGYTTRALTDEKYGKTSYQELSNDWLRCGQENVAVELLRNGLKLGDLTAPINLFSKIVCKEDGHMQFVTGHAPAQAAVTLRTEMELLVIMSNTPHPLDPAKTYPSVPVRLQVQVAPPVEEMDECVCFRPENGRAFDNTWEYHRLLGVK